MKENVKVFLIALVIGMITAFLVCYKYDNSIFADALENKITYFYVGSYNNIDDATAKKNKYKTAMIYLDNDIYKVVIGIYNKKDSIALMESYFTDLGYTYHKSTLKVDNEFIRNINSYEVLIKSSNKSYYENINESILNSFKAYNNSNVG